MRKNQKHTKRTAIILIVILMFALVSVVEATESELKEQLDYLDQKIQEQEDILKEKKGQENSALAELRQLNNTLSSVEKDLQSTESQLKKTQQELAKLEQEIEETETELDNNKGILSNRLVAMYEQGEASIFEVLLDSTNFSDFLTRWDFFSRLAENDSVLIAEINGSLKTLQDNQNLVLVKRDNLNKLIDDKGNQQKQIQIASSRQKEIYNSIKSDRVTVEQALDQLAKESQSITVQLKKLLGNDNSVYLGAGKMAWPTPGYTRITSDYGWRKHPILKTRRFHTGTDIAAPHGYKIVAAEYGTVIDVSWHDAYGRLIMIDHGGGIVTMYAHTSASLVKPGETVAKGQQIGKIGTTGWSTGPHLHFEVRINGDTVDPMTHLK